MHRRTLLFSGASLLGLWACGSRAAAGDKPTALPVPKELERVKWSQILTREEYRILRDKGTERAFSGDLWDHKADGIYTCAGCGLALFDSKDKFKSGTGWPSYTRPIAKGRVEDVPDHSWGMVRVENVCARCKGHLGHVFEDGPEPTGKRFCINSASMDFVPRDEARKLKGNPIELGGWSGPVTVKEGVP